MIIGSSSLTALKALGVGIQVTADNSANALTNGFQAAKTVYAERPFQGGVEPHIIRPAPENCSPGSNTQVVEETVNLIVTQRTYQANLKPVIVQDEMSGAVIDLKT